MAKIKIFQDPEKRWPKLTVDGAELPYVNFNLEYDPTMGFPSLKVAMYLKSGEVDVNGKVQINGIFVSDSIARQFYNQLKKKFENLPDIRVPLEET